MKIILKGQNGLVAKSDNTKVVQRPVIFPIKYKIKPGETFVTDRATGKKVLIRQKNETVSANRKSTYQEQQDQKKVQQVYKQYKENKHQEEGMKNLQGFFNFISPSTYIGPIFNNNNKSYLDNVLSGEGTGNVASNMAIDLLTPLSVNKVSKVIQTVPKTVGQKYVAPYILSKILNRNNPTIEAVNDLFNINFINRNTVFGKNSGKAIHADYGNNIGGFTKGTTGTTGASIINGKLVPGHNPNTEVDYIWWNVDKPYATGIKERAFTRYIIKNEKSIPGIINIREQSRPIGQWNGKSGFVTKSERVTPEPVPLDDATIIEYNPITRVYENKLIVPGNRPLK